MKMRGGTQTGPLRRVAVHGSPLAKTAKSREAVYHRLAGRGIAQRDAHRDRMEHTAWWTRTADYLIWLMV